MFDDPFPLEISGRLLDFSQSGFRAAHSYAALVSGQVVQFQHALARGLARVVWNRILEGTIETGFVVLANSPGAEIPLISTLSGEFAAK